jgi:hypothetical protein
MAVEDFDVVDGADPLPDVRLQQPPAQQVQLDCRGAAEFAPLLSSRQLLRATTPQHVEVAALRDSAALAPTTLLPTAQR